MLIANPVPEADEIPADEMAGYIDAAHAAADGATGISGKAVTPFLLAKILELTEGASLKTNIALVENNARLAAKIALGADRAMSYLPARSPASKALRAQGVISSGSSSASSGTVQ